MYILTIYSDQYKAKLTTAAGAVSLVKSGDYIEYSNFTAYPYELDKALAKRKDELSRVFVRVTFLLNEPEITKADPEGDIFVLMDYSWSKTTRKLHREKKAIWPLTYLYHEMPMYYSHDVYNCDYVFFAVTPMDKNGYFNCSAANSHILDIVRAKGGKGKNLKVIAEINPKLPVVPGDNYLHISDVDLIVEAREPVEPVSLPKIKATEIDEKIADYIMGQMVDGACLQLGIGGMPNLVGKKIAESDLKDLGCHTEMFVDAYMDLILSGKLTNKKKNVFKERSVFTFGMGSKELYEFMNGNPGLYCAPVSYVNDPYIIGLNDNVISINSCLCVDIMGNISSESSGYSQISGTGGQLDYHYGAFRSKGGKGFLCMPSTKILKNGEEVSTIVTGFPQGTKISVPSSMVSNVVTEYGIANLMGLSTWEVVEGLLSIAHPKFRSDIEKAAETAGIWRRSNKIR